MRIASAISATSRRSGVRFPGGRRRCRGRRGGRSRGGPGGCSAGSSHDGGSSSPKKSKSRMSSSCVVIRPPVPAATLDEAQERTAAGNRRREEFQASRPRGPVPVSSLAIPSDPRARPRPLPAGPPARERRLRLGLARPRRADRARRRAEDHHARGEGRGARRARGAGRAPAAPRPLRARVRRRPRLEPRLHRVRVRRRAHAARGDADGRGRRRRRRRDRGAGARRARPRAPHGHRPPRRQAVEHPARGIRDEIAARLLDFGLAQFDGADTLTAVGDVPGTLAYIAPERLAGEEATAESDVWSVGVVALGVARGQAPVLGRPAPGGRQGHRGRRAATRERAPRPPTEAARGRRRRARADPEARPARLGARLRPPRRASAGAARETRTRPRPRATPARRSQAAPASGRRRSAGRRSPSLTAAVGATLLPFWPAALVAALALGAGLAAWLDPRLGLAVALAAPVFPIGNVVAGRGAPLRRASRSRGSPVAWRDARCGAPLRVGPAPRRASGSSRSSRSSSSRRGASCGAPSQAARRGARRRADRGAREGGPSARGRARASRLRSRRSTRRSRSARRSYGALLASPLVLVGSRGRRQLPRRSSRWPAGGRATACSRSERRCSRASSRPARASSRSCSWRSPGALRAAVAAGGTRVDSARVGKPPMSVFRTIESKIEGLFEGVFGRAFRTHVQPIELARKLAKEMDDHRTVSVSRVYVPNEYTIYLSPEDRQQFDRLRGVARRRAPGVPRGARAPRAVRAPDRAGRARDDRRGPRRRRVRDRDAPRLRGRRRARARASRLPELPLDQPAGQTMIYRAPVPGPRRGRRRAAGARPSARS